MSDLKSHLQVLQQHIDHIKKNGEQDSHYIQLIEYWLLVLLSEANNQKQIELSQQILRAGSALRLSIERYNQGVTYRIIRSGGPIKTNDTYLSYLIHKLNPTIYRKPKISKKSLTVFRSKYSERATEEQTADEATKKWYSSQPIRTSDTTLLQYGEPFGITSF